MWYVQAYLGVLIQCSAVTKLSAAFINADYEVRMCNIPFPSYCQVYLPLDL
jgi:hypothetical protein